MSMITVPPPLSEVVMCMLLSLASFLSACTYLRGRVWWFSVVFCEAVIIPWMKPFWKSVSVCL